MKWILAWAVVLLAGGVGWGAVVETHYEQGPITIVEAGPFDDDKQVIIEVGKQVQFTIKIYQDEFFGETIISANAYMKNLTAQTVRAVYSISFYNAQGEMVACNQGSWELEANDDANYGSGLIYIDAKSIASITSYQLRTQVLAAE